MSLIIKLSFSGSSGPEIRLFEIDRDTSYDGLLRRIAARLPSANFKFYGNSTSASTASSEELESPPPPPPQQQQQQQPPHADGDVSLLFLPWSLVRDGVCACDIVGDWITISSEEEWSLFLRSCLPCAFDDGSSQDNLILNVQVRSPAPAVYIQNVVQPSNTFRKIGSALKNLFVPSVSSRRVVKSIESTEAVAPQATDQPQTVPNDNEGMETEKERKEEEKVDEVEELEDDEFDDDDEDDLESSVVTSNEIVDPEDSLLPNVSQSLGEISPVSELHPDPSQADSPSEMQVGGSFEIIDENVDTSSEHQEQQPAEIAVELPAVSVPPEFQEAWDVLVEMGFSDHSNMLALLKKHKSKNLPRIVDLLLQMGN